MRICPQCRLPVSCEICTRVAITISQMTKEVEEHEVFNRIRKIKVKELLILQVLITKTCKLQKVDRDYFTNSC